MQTLIHSLDWTIDTAALIAENDDYVVSLYDRAAGDYEVAYIRAKAGHPAAERPDAERPDAEHRVAMREARVAFTLAMHRR
jgi:hypothetical protein